MLGLPTEIYEKSPEYSLSELKIIIYRIVHKNLTTQALQNSHSAKLYVIRWITVFDPKHVFLLACSFVDSMGHYFHWFLWPPSRISGISFNILIKLERTKTKARLTTELPGSKKRNKRFKMTDSVDWDYGIFNLQNHLLTDCVTSLKKYKVCNGQKPSLLVRGKINNFSTNDP